MSKAFSKGRDAGLAFARKPSSTAPACPYEGASLADQWDAGFKSATTDVVCGYEVGVIFKPDGSAFIVQATRDIYRRVPLDEAFAALGW